MVPKVAHSRGIFWEFQGSKEVCENNKMDAQLIQWVLLRADPGCKRIMQLTKTASHYDITPWFRNKNKNFWPLAGRINGHINFTFLILPFSGWGKWNFSISWKRFFFVIWNFLFFVI